MISYGDQELFEFKIIYSLLSQRKVEMAYRETNFTRDFLKMVTSLSYCTNISFSEDNKERRLIFKPGSIIGGKHKIDCKQTPISRFLVPILIIAPFSRKVFDITFTGITNEDGYVSCDSIRLIYMKTYKHFNVPNVNMTINKRGFGPLGMGEVRFTSPNVTNLEAINYYVEKLHKIRGMAITSRVNASIAHNMIEIIKKTLRDDTDDSEDVSNEEGEHFSDSDDENKQNVTLTKNIKIFCDIANRNDSGPSPGYQCTLFAEGNNFYFGESCKTSIQEDFEQKIVEQTGKNETKNLSDIVDEAVLELLESIQHGGAFDRKCNPVLFSFLCLNLQDVSKVEIGPLSVNDKKILSLLNDFFAFNYEIIIENGRTVFKCFGINYTNYFKIIQ
ncbi:hypothetical protein EDEG_02638 [Edhazardia aedis USNM 41457]|uniref:RNA 3'-terminal phosphate cyclase domain-containing protein n=1 Tax=Edhazardia aedis (strain USNM 41457) TaxID=1003232 RepID=J9D627_EDHAE|nr:hypothetical protein EDEG_02638 [Edhazardia aedis USNM 41457]|eukprot:EJW02994.1 hypothetical protein EDEG_02638 [Edhazardia aedis USNM 41457]